MGSQTPEQLRSKGAASRQLLQEMHEQGVFVFADGGIDASTVLCSVTAEGDRAVFSPGTYTRREEHLGGFTVIEVADDEAARYWAGRLAVCLDWPQEVHRFPTFEEIVGDGQDG
ncbi:YciI family protein [Dermacoccaceae bacterium W4C1]